MHLNRRSFLVAAGAVGASALPWPAAAASDYAMNVDEEALWDQLARRSVYVRDGVSSRVLYVIYAPWSPACRNLYEATRNREQDVELRWVPVAPNGDDAAAYLVDACFTLAPSSLKAAFEKQRVMNDASKAFRQNAGIYQTYTTDAIGHAYTKVLKHAPGYPFLIGRKVGGPFIYYEGIPRDIDKFLSQVSSPVVPTDLHAPSARLLFRDYAAEKIATPKAYYARADETKTYGLPHRAAISMYSLKKDTGAAGWYRAVVDGELWVGLRIFQPSGPWGEEAMNWVPEADLYQV